MLKITSQNKPGSVTLKLEGCLTGVWVSELLDAWRAAQCSGARRTIRIDLTAVHQVDKAGEYLLALLHGSGSALVGSGVMMNALIQNIAHDWPAREAWIPKEA
jgi:ABC-type transporter Mla MlaB component